MFAHICMYIVCVQGARGSMRTCIFGLEKWRSFPPDPRGWGGGGGGGERNLRVYTKKIFARFARARELYLTNFSCVRARGQCCSTLSLVARDAHPWDKHALIKKHASTHALTLLWVETFSNAEMYYLWDCVNSTKQ